MFFKTTTTMINRSGRRSKSRRRVFSRTVRDISREFAEERARGHSAKGRAFKKPEESWLGVYSRVYLIARGNLMSRTKCT